MINIVLGMLLQLLWKSLSQLLSLWLFWPNSWSYMHLPLAKGKTTFIPRVGVPLEYLMTLECYGNNEVSSPTMGIK